MRQVVVDAAGPQGTGADEGQREGVQGGSIVQTRPADQRWGAVRADERGTGGGGSHHKLRLAFPKLSRKFRLQAPHVTRRGQFIKAAAGCSPNPA